ncbi:hypothetical protein DSM112329_00335 [Paraconexibacter sp. AEG42_29]|uniref:HTH tetR-type domain-containing protein n=1 Tax=Paraconexibacter sp. AEG42_29 TaxID=2997339 RepID=A0AAU7AQ74_9ACTN
MARNPLRLETPERHALLTAHFVRVVEELIEAGESYSDFSVERLIRAGDVSRATFYSYFESKSGLLQAMVKDITSEISQAGFAWWDAPSSMTRDDLREALRPSVLAYLEHKTLLRAVAEAAAYDEDIRATYGALMTDTIARLGAHIAAGQADGSVAAELDQEHTATWVVWMLERGLYQSVSLAESGAVDRWVESLTDIIWRTLYAGCR